MTMSAPTGCGSRLPRGAAAGEALRSPVDRREEGAWKRPLFLILILAVLLRAASFTGYAGSDDASYAELAHALSRGVWDPRVTWGLPRSPAGWGYSPR